MGFGYNVGQGTLQGTQDVRLPQRPNDERCLRRTGKFGSAIEVTFPQIADKYMKKVAAAAPGFTFP